MRHSHFIIILALLIASHFAVANNLCRSLFGADTPVSQSEIAPRELATKEIRDMLATDRAYFDKGKFKGQEIDHSRFRPVERIAELETETHYFVKNYTHHGKFWIARIPKNSIRDMILQLSLFNGPLGKQLGHAQMRFITNEPVILFRVNESGQVVFEPVKDFSFAFEAARPTGAAYNGIDALMGRYKIVSRLVSSFDRNFVEQVMDGDIVSQYRLINISPEQRNQLLENAINLATEKKLDFNYDTAKANCINYLFDIIDKTLGLDQPRVNTSVPRLLVNGPNPIERIVIQALRDRDLLGPNSRLPDYQRVHRSRINPSSDRYSEIQTP